MCVCERIIIVFFLCPSLPIHTPLQYDFVRNSFLFDTGVIVSTNYIIFYIIYGYQSFDFTIHLLVCHLAMILFNFTSTHFLISTQPDANTNLCFTGMSRGTLKWDRQGWLPKWCGRCMPRHKTNWDILYGHFSFVFTLLSLYSLNYHCWHPMLTSTYFSFMNFSVPIQRLSYNAFYYLLEFKCK